MLSVLVPLQASVYRSMSSVMRYLAARTVAMNRPTFAKEGQGGEGQSTVP